MSDLEQVLWPDSEKYNRLKTLCDRLNKVSPNKHHYVLRDVYKDHDDNERDSMWTNIIDTTTGCEVLSPRLWFSLVYNNEDIYVVEKEYFESNWCQDKRGD